MDILPHPDCRWKEISNAAILYHSAGRLIVQRPDDFNKLVVDVVFFWDSPEAFVSDTIERFLEVDDIMKEFLLMFHLAQLGQNTPRGTQTTDRHSDLNRPTVQ